MVVVIRKLINACVVRPWFITLVVTVIGTVAIVGNFLSMDKHSLKIEKKTACDRKDLSQSIGRNVLLGPNDTASYAAHESLYQELDLTTMLRKIKDKPECLEVASNPKSYWRSQPHSGSLNTSETDLTRMVTAFSCGMLYPEFFSKSPVAKLYSMEKFYLSEPRLTNISDCSSEDFSTATLFNSSSAFKVGDTVAIKIEMRDGKKSAKVKGGDLIRVWFVDKKNKKRMAATVTDLNNGTYLAVAYLPWVGTLRVNVALAYPREYLRAVLYFQRIMKTFRPIAAEYRNSIASEATPCYHTQVVPAFDRSELCNFTKINGSPWFCGRPVKSQLNCSDFIGTIVVGPVSNYPFTDAEMEALERSCS